MADMASANSAGIAFLVSAGIVFEIIAAACSSPQTAEINAGTRATTLMKWVNIGVGTAAVFVIAAAVFDPRYRLPILAGGVLAGGIMYVYYWYAKNAGVASSAPGTESTPAPVTPGVNLVGNGTPAPRLV